MQIVLLLVGLAVGAALGWLVASSRAQARRVQEQMAHEAALRHLQSQSNEMPEGALSEADHLREVALVKDALTADHALVVEELAVKRAELAAARESVLGLQRSVQDAKQQLMDTVAEHRREAKQRETAGEAESKVLQQLAPVTKQLGDMGRRLNDMEKDRSEQHGQLAAQLRETKDAAAQSKLAAETLASALKNNAQRGVYGETQLTSLVESAGLLRRVDFSTQESITAESGSRRPDMVLWLPGGKQMAIDAKVPYAAFIEANTGQVDDDRRADLRRQHARAVKAHVDQLAAKNYWTGLDASPEFTIAFIPNDAILNDALDADPSLMEHAFEQGIVLATPVNLWAVLKTVAFTWKQEILTEDAKKLFDLGNELYARLGKLGATLGRVGGSLETTVKRYNEFVGSFETRVMVTARRFDRLDESRVLPEVVEIEADPRGLTASEFSLFDDLERPEIDPAVVRGESTQDDRRFGTA